eukprot:1839832-Rhodomonas_salina.3
MRCTAAISSPCHPQAASAPATTQQMRATMRETLLAPRAPRDGVASLSSPLPHSPSTPSPPCSSSPPSLSHPTLPLPSRLPRALARALRAIELHLHAATATCASAPIVMDNTSTQTSESTSFSSSCSNAKHNASCTLSI